MEEIKQAVQAAVKELFNVDVEPELTRPDEQFGDYATNVALQLAGKLSNPPAGGPQEIATKLADKLNGQGPIAKAEFASPGFLNIRLKDDILRDEIYKMIENKGKDYGKSKQYDGKIIVAEYSDPNPFKVLHAGHLYTSVVGDAIANLLEYAGAQVHRVNFGGDVGLHVAKTMWAIIDDIGGEDIEKFKARTSNLNFVQSEWMTNAYVHGTKSYDENEEVKDKVTELNKRIYQLHTDNDHDSSFAQIYWTCRQWSYDYFDKFYANIGTKFDKYYPESKVAPLGIKIVQEQLEKGVYARSDGAIIFEGEKYGLHTRVFINSEGLPTYEAKDVGLIMTKWQDYHFDKSVVITGNDIVEYMKVVLKSVEQFQPDLVKATTHLTHGIVKLQGGEKMSSRKGNILRAVDVLDVASQANQKATGKADKQVELGAVKYSFLKNRTGGDIIYDPEESVSLQGNSGPYLQYAYVRALSIIRKKAQTTEERNWKLDDNERSLVRKMSEYPEVIEKATVELTPHNVCAYLYELAQKFNNFYEHNRVLNNERQDYRLLVVAAYAGILQNGLTLLGIPTPEKM